MRRLVFILMVAVLSLKTLANNLQIGTPALNASNELVFTVSWDNSWYTNSAPHNWDGVYLFVKYRNCASTNAWEHVSLSTSASAHSAQSPLMIDPYKLADGKGVIIRRSAPGSGNIVNDTVKLKIVTPALGSSYDFQVFGIEMVYIPTGSFYLGDGASSYTITAGATNNPLMVTSDGALTRGTAATNIYCNSSTGTLNNTIPSTFPVGYDSVYVMKYEISQGQYAAFLNTLSSDQCNSRYATVNANRVNLTGTWPNIATTFPHRAIAFLSWPDLLAYLDWAALSPMTETQYEKICRGPNIPVAAEYAWGTSTISDCNAISNDGTTTEKNTTLPTLGTGLANYNNNTILGPVRCGYAGSPTTDRLQSGSSYYGVMELSGNVWEMCVSIYNNVGVSYTGQNGDGYLTNAPSAGFADVSNWPNITSASTGVSTKGGAWDGAAGYLRVSDRSNYTWGGGATRYSYIGGRGIR